MLLAVRPVRPGDLEQLPALEAAADALFEDAGIGPLPPRVGSVEELADAAAVLVVGDPVVGFARLERVDGQAHLEQLSVHPSASRRGVGTALLEAAAGWAARSGHEALTLCTFADVPWNGPFYARHGFVELTDPGPALRQLRDTERRLGLDALGRRVVLRRGVGPEAVLADLTAGLEAVLGDDLLGLYVHGSLVAGDFAPSRSDLDVLAVVGRPPDDTMLAVVTPVFTALADRHPAWRGRVEVETVAQSTVHAYAGRQADGADRRDDRIMRISPGEPLHLLPASNHRVLTWATVRATGRVLSGPPATDVLPPWSEHTVEEALLDHARDWPTGVESMTTGGAQAYSVLSVCRAWCALVGRERLSKRAAANRFVGGHPQDADLVVWARDWWYADGSDSEAGRFDEVRDFVVRTTQNVVDAVQKVSPVRRS
jgi:GNAT superfamily N-acetyltransferase